MVCRLWVGTLENRSRVRRWKSTRPKATLNLCNVGDQTRLVYSKAKTDRPSLAEYVMVHFAYGSFYVIRLFFTSARLVARDRDRLRRTRRESTPQSTGARTRQRAL